MSRKLEPEAMKPSSHALAEKAIKLSFVSVRNESDDHVGAGLAVSQDHVVTCAHVIRAALSLKRQAERPQESVEIVFEFVSPNERLTANVIEWVEECDNPRGEVEDLAVLKLERPLPAGVVPQPLVAQGERALEDFSCYGISEEGPTWVHGQFQGEDHRGREQLHSKRELRIGRGFSGGGVWDHKCHGFAGIVVTSDNRDNRHGIGYITKAMGIVETWPDCPRKQCISPELQEYLDRLVKHLDVIKSFASFDREFEYGMVGLDNGNESEVMDAGQVLERMLTLEKKRWAVISGTGGSGKSSQLGRIVRRLLVTLDSIPVLVRAEDFPSAQLGTVIKPEQTTSNIEYELELLLSSACLVDWPVKKLRNLDDELPLFFLIDAINETGRNEEELFDCLGKYFLANSQDFCVVTSRSSLRTEAFNWCSYQMRQISKDGLEKIVREEFGGELDSVDPKLLEILRTPFFLQLARDQENLDFKSPTRADILARFFQNPTTSHGLGMKSDQLTKVGEIALEMYRETGTTSFKLQSLQERLDPELLRTLNGTLITERDNASFDHQLKHDFLISWYFANVAPELRDKVWTNENFDAATFHALNVDPLAMTVESLPPDEPNDNDLFLKRIYNWHLGHALTCLVACLSRGGQGSVFSKELCWAVTALIADKKGDRILHTRKLFESHCDTVKNCETLKPTEHGTFFDLDDARLRNALIDMESDSQWFKEWRRVFCGDADALGVHFLDIEGDDPVMAWTVANSIRRPDVATLEHTGLLSGMLLVTKDMDKTKKTENQIARWRMAHALGGCPYSYLAERALLERLNDEDEYVWVRYGSGRSLIELAARAKSERRAKIVHRIRDVIENPDFGSASGRLSREGTIILREIGRCVLFRSVPEPDDWIALVNPIVDFVDQKLRNTHYKRSWAYVRSRFEASNWIREGVDRVSDRA